MRKFKNKQEVFGYIVRKLQKGNKVILIRGSTAYGPVKKFSDFDVEVYGGKLQKPYYELCLVSARPVIISAYFYRYREGKLARPEHNVRVLFGKYNNRLKPDFSKERYTLEQRIKREYQMVVDSLFKYLRHRDKKDLERVQKRI